MKLTLTTPILDADGKPAKDLTVGKAIEAALLSQADTDRATGEQKDKRYRMWQRVVNKDEAEFTTEEMAVIKSLVGVVWSTIVVGQVYDAIEGRQGSPAQG